MNKMDAYSKLFSIDDNDLDKKYYVRLLSTSDEVPQEVIDYLESFESESESPDEVVVEEVSTTDEIVETDSVVEESDTEDEEPSITNDVELEDDEVVVEDQSDVEEAIPEVKVPVIEIEEQVVEDTQDSSEVVESDEEIKVEEPEVDPIVILKDFYDHLKKASVYRKIRNSDNPDNLCKSVSSFCTRYLIELHSSGYDSELVRSTVSERINVGDVLRLLANYVEFGDLNSLAKSVVIIRNFLDKLDKEFNEVND